METTLTLIGDKWKVLILRDLTPGTKRFGELRKSVGDVSQKVLAAQLRDMEKSGLVHREVYAEVPPRVEYSPDPAGPEPEAHSGLHVGLGRGIQGIPGMKKRREALEKKRFTAFFVIFSAEHR